MHQRLSSGIVYRSMLKNNIHPSIYHQHVPQPGASTRDYSTCCPVLPWSMHCYSDDTFAMLTYGSMVSVRGTVVYSMVEWGAGERETGRKRRGTREWRPRLFMTLRLYGRCSQRLYVYPDLDASAVLYSRRGVSTRQLTRTTPYAW